MSGLASWILDEANRREAVLGGEEMGAPELRRFPCRREERKPRLVLVGGCGADAYLDEMDMDQSRTLCILAVRQP